MAETWAETLQRLFPKEIDGGVRPAEPIPTDLPFSTEFPQFIANDDNWYEQDNAFLRLLLSDAKALNLGIEALKKALTQEDFKIVTELMKGLMSPEMLKKLNGIAANANNYAHPAGAGNKHIPAGGSTGKILKWASDGTAQWVDEYSYTHSTASGSKHIPSGGSSGKILRWLADGTAVWGDDVNTWRGVQNNLASTSTEESLSAAMGKKLQDEKAPILNANFTGDTKAVHFLASQGSAGHGYSFQNDGASDTGMFSDSDGDLYFLQNGVKTLLSALARLVSPAFTGTPTAPTAAQSTNNTQIATTAFVKAAIALLVNSSPAALDTLQELAAALGNDPNFATTVTNALAGKAPTANPAFTGAPTAPTPGTGDNSTRIATTAFVQALVASLSAAFGGTGLLAPNGWWKFPGGLILQWGAAPESTVGTANTNYVTVTFPVRYSNACFAVLSSFVTPHGASACGINSKSNTGCSVGYANMSGGTKILQAYWISIGG